jgi:glyoxylase-like metal-dependent hydrolase (beta-lactamase superfamily II)
MELTSFYRSKLTTPANAVERIASVATLSKGMADLSRRRFIAAAGLGAGTAVFAPRLLFAQETGIVPTMINEAARAKIEVHSLRRNISVLEGSGGNIAVLTGKGGKLLIDSGFTVSRVRIAAALNGLSSAPLTQLINTHWHVDHTDGNAWVHSAGATITAHQNTKKRLSTSTRVEGWSYTFPPAPAGAIPTTVFDDDHQVHQNNTRIALKYYGPAHTDSDISVLFEEADIIHVGDTWWNGFYPFIDYSTGGSIDGMIRATGRNLAMVTDKTIIIPGHGPVGNKAGLTEYHDMLIAIRSNVAELKQQGKSLSETIAAEPTSAYDTKWGQFLMTPAIFTGLVYAGV